jgi:hypothetical protein
VFEFLAIYRGLTDGPRRFYPVEAADIDAAERQLGFAFPPELRAFYSQVGYGWLGADGLDSARNLFVHPLDVVDLLNGSSEFAPPEGFLAGDLPFFDAGGGCFLVVRPNSRRPLAVFRDSGDNEPVASDVVEFCRRLARDPGFYSNV